MNCNIYLRNRITVTEKQNYGDSALNSRLRLRPRACRVAAFAQAH
jgi:hypothetical protein